MEHGLDAFELLEQALKRGEIAVVGQHHGFGAELFGDRSQHAGDTPVDLQPLADIPVDGTDNRNEPQRLAGRRAINHNDVVDAFAGILVDVQEGDDVFHARHDRGFLRDNTVKPTAHQQIGDVFIDIAPVAPHLLLDVDLLEIEIVPDRHRTTFGRAEQFVGHVEAVGETVREIEGHHDGLFAAGSQRHRGRSRGGGLADTTLAGHHDDPRLAALLCCFGHEGSSSEGM